MDPNMSYHRLYAAPPPRSELCLSQLTDSPHDAHSSALSLSSTTADTPTSSPLSTAPTRKPWSIIPRSSPADSPKSLKKTITFTCISDTHNTTPYVPLSDVLLHAGDLTNQGSYSELKKQLDWLSSLPHQLKIVIAGNHDGATLDADFYADFGCYMKYPTPQNPIINHELFAQYSDRGIHYLEHEMREFTLSDGRKFSVFGSPWIPICGSWGFMYSRDSERAEQLWRDIPEDVDVLLTHTPARFVGDSMNAPGCDALRRRIEKTRPRLHIFGHVHQAYGVTRIIWEEMNTRSTGTVGRSEVVEDTGEKKKVWRVQANGKKGKDTLCVNAAMKGLGKKSIVVGLEEAAEEDLKNWRVKARKISGGLMFNSSES